MREILFRGKTSKGDWVYGHIGGNRVCPEVIFPFNDFIGIKVIPETVGQFTGLTDKNGKKIFEGDIVKGTIVSSWNKEPIKCKVVYKRDGFICEETLRGARICDHKVCFAKNIEIIGNIHDNPELLGEQYGK